MENSICIDTEVSQYFGTCILIEVKRKNKKLIMLELEKKKKGFSETQLFLYPSQAEYRHRNTILKQAKQLQTDP